MLRSGASLLAPTWAAAAGCSLLQSLHTTAWSAVAQPAVQQDGAGALAALRKRLANGGPTCTWPWRNGNSSMLTNLERAGPDLGDFVMGKEMDSTYSLQAPSWKVNGAGHTPATDSRSQPISQHASGPSTANVAGLGIAQCQKLMGDTAAAWLPSSPLPNHAPTHSGASAWQQRNAAWQWGCHWMQHCSRL
jgi:hypothetical protein